MDSDQAEAEDIVSKRRSQGSDLCVYCGIRWSETSDHVVPKLLFDQTPKNPLTVPACKPCHDEKSDLDQYLRDYLVADWDGSQHPIAVSIAEGPFIRAVGSNRSLLMRQAVDSIERVAIVSPAGEFLGTTFQFDVDPFRLTKELEYITRGLSFAKTGQRIDAGARFKANRIENEKIEAVVNGLHAHVFSGSVQLGNGVFEAIYAHTSENPNLFILITEFYRRVLFLTSFGWTEANGTVRE